MLPFHKDVWKKDIDAAGNDVYENVWWAFSMLSDAQELITMGRRDDASEKINNAKRVLLGLYEVAESGFSSNSPLESMRFV